MIPRSLNRMSFCCQDLSLIIRLKIMKLTHQNNQQNVQNCQAFTTIITNETCCCCSCCLLCSFRKEANFLLTSTWSGHLHYAPFSNSPTFMQIQLQSFIDQTQYSHISRSFQIISQINPHCWNLSKLS